MNISHRKDRFIFFEQLKKKFQLVSFDEYYNMLTIKNVLLIGILVICCTFQAESEDIFNLDLIPQLKVNASILNVEKYSQQVGPLLAFIKQDPKTGVFHLFCQEEFNSIDDRYDIIFSEMRLLTGTVDKKLKGEITKYPSRIGWTSKDFKELTDGDILKGKISAKSAVEKHIFEGLKKGDVLKKHGVTIELKKYDGSKRFLCPLGEYGLWEVTEENKDRMWYAVVKADDSMSHEDNEFVKQVQLEYQKGSYPYGETMEKYKQLKLKTPTVKVLDIWRMPTKDICIECIEGTHESEEDKFYCRLERSIDHEVAFGLNKSEIGFDCLQDGSDVFPVGLEVVKYEPRTFEFAIKYQGSGLKTLDHPGKPKSNKPRENIIGMQFVWIPAGSFSMGSKLSPEETSDRYGGIEKPFNHEHPQHDVTISKGFWMSCYEVTQLQYKKIMGNNPSNYRFKCPHCDNFLGSNLVKEGALDDIGGDHPVDTVSWDNAMAFCKKLSEKEGIQYTLPTEAQWEYSCRAGTKSTYYFGDDSEKLKDYGWFEDNSNMSTHPVGEKQPNPWGLYDMYGNVSEWCLDWYSSTYYSQNFPKDPINNTPTKGKYKLKVLRGGSTVYPDKHCRSASRDYSFINLEPDCGNGFRIIYIPK